MNTELNVVVHDGTGPPLLLVHGMLASRSQWLLNLALFSTFATPITIELLGHHLASSPTDSAAYSPSNYVVMFEELRKQLQIDRWFLGGCSLGAALTMRYTLNHPSRVFAQFLTNSSSAFADDESCRKWRLQSEASYNHILQGGMATIERIAVHPRHAKRLPESVKQALVKDSKSHAAIGIASTMRWTSPYASVRNDVNGTCVPSMLLCGRFETRFRPLLRFATKKVPALVVHELPAGHGVNMEAADAFNEHVAACVTEHTKTLSRAF